MAGGIRFGFKSILAGLMAVSFAAAMRAGAQDAVSSDSKSTIEISYYLAFCRAPTAAEAEFWMKEPSSRDLKALMTAHGNWLKTQAAEREDTIRRAFAMVLARRPEPEEIAFIGDWMKGQGTGCRALMEELFQFVLSNPKTGDAKEFLEYLSKP